MKTARITVRELCERIGEALDATQTGGKLAIALAECELCGAARTRRCIGSNGLTMSVHAVRREEAIRLLSSVAHGGAEPVELPKR